MSAPIVYGLQLHGLQAVCSFFPMAFAPVMVEDSPSFYLGIKHLDYYVHWNYVFEEGTIWTCNETNLELGEETHRLVVEATYNLFYARRAAVYTA